MSEGSKAGVAGGVDWWDGGGGDSGESAVEISRFERWGRCGYSLLRASTASMSHAKLRTGHNIHPCDGFLRLTTRCYVMRSWYVVRALLRPVEPVDTGRVT